MIFGFDLDLMEVDWLFDLVVEVKVGFLAGFDALGEGGLNLTKEFLRVNDGVETTLFWLRVWWVASQEFLSVFGAPVIW